MARCMTEEECSQAFLDQIDAYTRDALRHTEMSREDLVRLAVFNVLVILDGESCLPPFSVEPAGTYREEEREDAIAEDQNWWPALPEEAVDIAGNLHNKWVRMKR